MVAHLFEVANNQAMLGGEPAVPTSKSQAKVTRVKSQGKVSNMSMYSLRRQTVSRFVSFLRFRHRNTWYVRDIIDCSTLRFSISLCITLACILTEPILPVICFCINEPNQSVHTKLPFTIVSRLFGTRKMMFIMFGRRSHQRLSRKTLRVPGAEVEY